MNFISKLMSVSFAWIGNKILETFKQVRFAAHRHPKVFDWGWNTTRYNRIAIVNFLISRTKGWNSAYLEIGCAGNVLFDAVASGDKTGVDPALGGTERTTSDEFFAKNNKKFDVIFIDGLHEYDQVRRDAINALECLNDNGWIAFHDFLPSNWKEHHVPRLQEAWTGDCWKLAIELSKASGVDFKIIKIDHGVGLLQKTSQNYSVPDLKSELLDAEFATFVECVGKLPLINVDEAVKVIKS